MRLSASVIFLAKMDLGESSGPTSVRRILCVCFVCHTMRVLCVTLCVCVLCVCVCVCVGTVPVCVCRGGVRGGREEVAHLRWGKEA